MSGTQCSDFGGTDQGANLCLMPAGHLFPGLITYRDGRVADIVSESGGTVVFAGPNGTGAVTMEGVSAESITITRDMAETEIGDCSARGMGGVSFSPMMSHYEGEPLTWSPAEARELSRILGVSGTRSGASFFCSNRENAGALVVANDTFHHPDLLAGIEVVESCGALTDLLAWLGVSESPCGTLDDTHRGAMLASLRTAASVPAPESWWDQIVSIGGYLLGGAIVFISGGWGSHVVSQLHSARVEAREAVREANFASERAQRFANEADTPEARRQAEIARNAARDAEAAARDGRTTEARRLLDRARTAADEAERIAEEARSARSRSGGPDDGDPPAAGHGGDTVVSGGNPAPNPGTTARVAVPDEVAGILAFHGMGVVPPEGGVLAPMSSPDGPMSVSGPLPVPVIPAAVAAPRPIAAPRPVMVPRLVPVL